MTYSSAMALQRQRAYSKNQTISLARSRQTMLGPISNTVMLVVMACLLGLIYVTQVTKTNTYGFKAAELGEKASVIENQTAQLEIEAERIRNLDSTQKSQVAAKLTPILPEAYAAH